ncbi:MAG: glycolate oxidase subunit GlcF [Chromatiales bacterium]|nr:glycolate oxidase subunit GlcF [Gammaproteobacteria bacterium]MBW6477067.1 glycolate oxidase subunit GlcF [Chromatiales bacterium]
MKTQLLPQHQQSALGQEADAILRSCVHCGFCTATCPTYQLLGDELDGPRGRIYLIKQVLEGNTPTPRTQLHLDRCLSCRGCETTCPSGVRYGRLLDIGRELVDETVERPTWARLQRRALRLILPHAGRFALLLGLARLLRPLLPRTVQGKIPVRQSLPTWPPARHARRMLVLQGCAQSVATPLSNVAAARVLDRLGISLIAAAEAGCCGALSHHLSAAAEARDFMRRNIDAWWPHIEQGAEAIVVSASGCGVMLKDYGKLLADDPVYAEKAARVATLSRDLGEVLAGEDLAALRANRPLRLAYHPPCTLQHGQQLPGLVEKILTRLGHQLLPIRDSHLCCGSAGTYSLLQPALSQQMLKNKLGHLTAEQPELIVTANVGCQLHLGSQSALPVRHWIELLDQH